MKIHLVTNLFYPDELAGASLYTDFARWLRDEGHEVRVTAAFSYYPAWKLRAEDERIAWRDEVFEGIPVRRCSMYIPSKPRGMSRLLSDGSFLVSLLRHGTWKDWMPDIVVTACPMLSQCLAQRGMYLGQGVKRLIIVQDFVVDAALELGILKLPGLGPLLRSMERFSLRSGKLLNTISPEMYEKLRSRVGRDKQLQYVPNWIHEDLQAEIDRQAQAAGEREEATLFYSGNLGIKQGLPDFLKDFAAVQSHWKLRLQGNGPDAERIRPLVDGKRIMLGDVEDVGAYVRRLLQATACLVTQQAGVTANFLPSKLLPALAARTPVLAVAEEATPLAREIQSGGYGLVIPPGDQNALEKALTTLANPAENQRMRDNAGERSVFFSRDRVLRVFTGLLEELHSVGS